MRNAPFVRLGLVVIAIAVLSGSAFATNGYFSHGIGLRAKAMGGAGVAFPQDALTGANNPAAPGFLGNRFDVGVDWFSPDRGSEIVGNAGGDMIDGVFDANGESNFFMPEIGYNNQYRDNMALGFAIYGRGGMNTSYTTPIPLFGTTKAGVDLMQVFLVPYVSYMVNDKHSIGAGINVAWQAFEACGLQNFAGMSSDSTSLTDNGHESSMGLGFTIGYMGRVHPMVDVGVAYASRTYMGRFKKYQGLFAEMGGFDIPPSLSGGITVRPCSRTTVAFDVQRIWYSQIKSINDPLLPNLREAPLGSDDGAGFGWQDVTAFKLGLKYAATGKVALLGGYNYGGQPIPESETLFNMLAPGVVEQHITLGAIIKAGSRAEVTLAYMHAFEKKVEGSGSIPAGSFEEGGFGGGEANLRMNENSFGAAVGWTF
jgi:long-chain fatty acid transport protein